ncbi:probable protein phosphatase 2C 76 [Arachis hypogaea]|uniref:probable protein phosphatase 2C 76 n=1 Tax=Arachis hypogaea TaxID=3818 RepID=UPI000788EE29
MEDFYDGHGGFRAAEYLKEHLFDNLMKHPKFFTDAKLAISEMYQGTDSQFLDSKKDTFWDDSSIASTTVLIDNYLYVANVGDSRTIISKAGKAITLSEDHKPNRSDERKKN